MENKNMPQRPQLAVELPSAPDVERSLLGMILTSPGIFDELRDTLTALDFYNVTNRELFGLVEAVSHDGNEVSLISLSQKAMATHSSISAADIAQLAAEASSGGSDWLFLARTLSDLRLRREAWLQMQEAAARALDPTASIASTIEQARRQLDNIQVGAGQEQHIVSDATLYQQLVARMADNRDPQTRHFGFVTGFDYLDTRAAFQPGDLAIIAGESSQGKSALALTIAQNARLRGISSAYFSLEMSGEQLASRMVAMQSGVSSSNILLHPLNDSDFRTASSIANALAARTDAAVYIDERPLSSIEPIIQSIRAMRKRRGIQMAVVDFLQRLVPPRGMSKEAFLGESAQRLKNVARELQICVIALSQLSRDRDNPAPSLSRLRDSGQLTEAADVVLLIYRPEAVTPFSSSRRFLEPHQDYVPHGNAQIIIGKGRNIGTGSFLCGFDTPTTHFYDKQLADIPRIGMGGWQDKPKDPNRPF